MTRPSHAATAIASLITEREWQGQVTPLGKGFPDIILCRGDRLILAELKAEHGRLTPEQRDVLDLLRPAVEVHVWRPTDLPAVLDTLR